MDNMEVLKAVSFGVLVTTFLLNTCRYLKAIDLSKECLILLHMEGSFLKTLSLIYNILIYNILFQAYYHIGDFLNAIQYGKELLLATRNFGLKSAESDITYKLAELYQIQSKFVEAKELYEKVIIIMRETGDRKGEADVYCNLGQLFLEFSGEHEKAKEYLEKAIRMKIEINDREGEARCYIGLSNVFIALAEYHKAEEYSKKALVIQMETGDSHVEGNAYLNQGSVCLGRGDPAKAKEYLEKALAKMKEARSRTGISTAYSKLGGLFLSVGEFVKAKQYYKKALAIRKEIGDKKGEGNVYGGLATLCDHFCQYAKAKEYLQKQLAITIEIGSRKGEATVYVCLGKVYQHLEEYDKAEEYFEKALAIQKKTGDRRGEVASNVGLGTICIFRGKYVSAERLLKKALSISEDIDDGKQVYNCYCHLGMAKLAEGKILDATSYLVSCIKKCEDLRGFLKDNDPFNISFSDVHEGSYRGLCTLFCAIGNTSEALHVVELGRARALADLMKSQYSAEEQILQPWFVRVERIMRNECQSSCLYISYSTSKMFLWILKTTGVIHYREVEISKYIVHDGSVQILDDIFEGSFRGFGILPEEDCEDRSLNSVQPKSSPAQEERTAGVRIVEEDDETQDSEPNLALYYKMIIAPVVDLLEESEIIIVPERSLYRVPFPALFETLSNGRIKYLSESYRIRIVPSLTTLELIQNSPKDYHSQADELIVGDPEVGRVMYKGKIVNISRLYHAGKEAEMIGQLLGTQPLIGQHATKQAVLQRISSVRLIHVAAHGHADRGEIALAPLRTGNLIPKEEDYLLTMSDISQAQLHAKLVVLSCCHSGRGQIRAEGVVGIARAFLGSGARSVLVALWALSDSATKQFMCRFYKHLVRGESASESLHETMKWMRANGYSDVGLWAPFMLIGDDVTFDFSK